MFRLRDSQLALLRRFLVRKYVRYEDVQVEIIDHLACAIEERMEADENLSFQDALKAVDDEFGVGGFAKIVQEKEASQRKFWRRHIWESFKIFLTLPLLLFTLAIFLLFTTIQINIEATLLNEYSVLAFTLLLCIIYCYTAAVNEESFNKYLFSRSYRSVSIMILYFTIYLTVMPFYSFGQEDGFLLQKTTPSIIFISLYYTVNLILIYILSIQIPNNLLAKYMADHKTKVAS